MDQAPAPVLDRACLDDLAEDLASRSDALDFAAAFVKLLPSRLHAIATALDAGRTEAAHIALVSLGASASMVGALRLERDVRLLVEDLGAGRDGGARESLRGLADDADAIAAALVEALGAPQEGGAAIIP